MENFSFSKIMDYKIYNRTKYELMDYIDKVSKINIISGNPEILYNGLNNEFLFNNFLGPQSLILPDGVGTVIASKIAGSPVKEKIAGIEVMEEIIKSCELNNQSIYLIGTKEEILQECIKNIQKKYPKIQIAGAHNGFFDLENCNEIVEDIISKKPHALFVAMGCPRQEKFISKYMDVLPCKFYMGVGGSFDVFAGKVNRAPKWMIRLGLEWAYRVAKEPFRIKRLASIPKFLLKVIYCTYIIKE